MALIVQKFGGSSVAEADRIRHVAELITNTYKRGNDVVVVLSAQGDTTDDLLEKAYEINPSASAREMDMLLATGEQQSIALMAMAIDALGYPAVSLTGWQVGLETNSNYGVARIKRVSGTRIREELDRRRIVLVAGFQGINKFGDQTTLGRGGSDTTAVALAVALKADICQIYTDVDGVYTADPRVVPNAIKLKEITFGEMLELARLGAGVMQPRAVEYGELTGTDIHVRSTFNRVEGTIIRGEYTMMEEKKFIIRGVASDSNVAKITVRGVPDVPGVAYRIFDGLAKENIAVDMIVQSTSAVKEKNDIVFTVTKTDMADTVGVLDKLKNEMGFARVDVEANVAKVSIVGAGMLGNPGVAARMFGALASENINLDVISTSEITISCLIAKEDEKKAVNVVHRFFFPADEK